MSLNEAIGAPSIPCCPELTRHQKLSELVTSICAQEEVFTFRELDTSTDYPAVGFADERFERRRDITLVLLRNGDVGDKKNLRIFVSH